MLRVLLFLTIAVSTFARNTGRIVGGHEIDIESAPWNTANLLNHFANGIFSHVCGGSLIRYNTIVSAAQCYRPFIIWDYSHPSYWRIRSGSKHKGQDGVISNVVQIIPHPSYDQLTVRNDIALLRIQNYLTPTLQVATIPLPAQDSEVEPSKYGFITGWGTTNFEGPSSDVLQAVEVPIVGREECNRLYADHNLNVFPDMLCAGDVQAGGVDACQGDSGSPLTVDGTLEGIASWGEECALPGYPGVYTRVAHFRTWMDNNISE